MKEDIRVSADPITLFNQASITANGYMVQAVHYIDRLYGDGYAKKNPDLVGTFMQICHNDFETGMTNRTTQILESAISELGGDIRGGLSELALSITELGRAL